MSTFSRSLCAVQRDSAKCLFYTTELQQRRVIESNEWIELESFVSSALQAVMVDIDVEFDIDTSGGQGAGLQ